MIKRHCFVFLFFFLFNCSGDKIPVSPLGVPAVTVEKVNAPLNEMPENIPCAVNWQFAAGEKIYSTSVKAAYLGNLLYLFFDNSGERSSKLMASPAEPYDREFMWKDSSNSIFIDPERTNSETMYFFFNSNGVKFGFGKYIAKNWKGGWDVMTGRGDAGNWAAFAKCDLSTTGFKPLPGSVWGINFSRHAGAGEGFFGYRSWPLNHYKPSCDFAFLVFGPRAEKKLSITGLSMEKKTDDEYVLKFHSSDVNEKDSFELLITNPELPSEKIFSRELLKKYSSDGIYEIPFKWRLRRDGRHQLTLITRNEKVLVSSVSAWEFYLSKIPERAECPLRFTPVKWEVSQGYWTLPENLKIAVRGKGDIFPAELLAEKLKEAYGIKVSFTDEKPDITLQYSDPAGFKNEEAYNLKINKDGVSIISPSARGIYYGVRSLLDYISLCFVKEGRAGAGFVYCEDFPDVPKRIFIWYPEFDLMYKARPDIGTYKKFFYEQIAGGRYNLVFIICKGAVKYDSHPELLKNPAYGGQFFAKSEIKEMADFLREHYVQVEPGGDSPGHSEWLAVPLPEISEDGADNVVCTGNPKTMTVLKDIYSELIELFKPAKYFFISGGEIFWQTAVAPPEKRCKICSGHDKGELLLEHFRELDAFCGNKGVAGVIWSDMLSPDWNGGGRWQTHKILQELPRDMVLVSWDPADKRAVSPLLLRKMGFMNLWRATTVFKSAQTDAMAETWNVYSGQGLAEDFPFLWCNFQPAGDETGYTTPAILCASSCTWRHENASIGFAGLIEKYGNAFTLSAGLPSFASRYFKLKAVSLAGTSSGISAEEYFKFKFRDNISIFSEMPENHFIKLRGDETSKEISLEAKVSGLIFSHSLRAASPGSAALLKKKFADGNIDILGLNIAFYEIKYDDGTVMRIPVRLGYNVHFMDCQPPLRVMQGVAGYKTGSSLEMSLKDPEARDIAFWFMAWKNPHIEKRLRTVRIISSAGKENTFIVNGIMSVN